VIVGAEDGPGWISVGQFLRDSLAVSVVPGATVDGKMGRLVDKRSSLGIGTDVRSPPEGTAEEDHSELVGIDVGEDARIVAGAVVGEARELAAADQLEVALDGPLARSGVVAEPGSISNRATRDRHKVRVGVHGIDLSAGGGSVEL